MRIDGDLFVGAVFFVVMATCIACSPKQTDHPGEIQVWCRLTGKVDSGDSGVFKSYIYNYECPKEGSVVAP